MVSPEEFFSAEVVASLDDEAQAFLDDLLSHSNEQVLEALLWAAKQSIVILAGRLIDAGLDVTITGKELADADPQAVVFVPTPDGTSGTYQRVAA